MNGQSFVLNWLRIFLHFIKACPDLPWLDQIYCSGYKLYCRRYWPDLPEMCRKWPRKKKIDRTNNFLWSAFFPRILWQHFVDTCPHLTDVFEQEIFWCFRSSPQKMRDFSLEKRMAVKVLEEVFIPRPGIFSQGEFRGSDFFHQFQNKFPRHLYFPQCFV